MARNNSTPAPEAKAPDFIAWHVANRGEKAFWTKVGAAWFNRDHKGISLVVPESLKTSKDTEYVRHDNVLDFERFFRGELQLRRMPAWA